MPEELSAKGRFCHENEDQTHEIIGLVGHNGEMPRFPYNLAFCVSVALTSCLGRAQGDSPKFSRDIQPILSDNCFQCHGPDEGSREADLRLDEKGGLLSVVGNPLEAESSEILRRINSDDPDEQMPPPSTKRSLSQAERILIREWIVAGAIWEGHWAFEKPHRPPLPDVKDNAWPKNPIDCFILSRLQSEQLKPSQRASHEKLLRRASLDLTGLPPSLSQLDTFVDDISGSSFSRVVESLLASPRFGERMAMQWLDAARYADTNGYQGDRERTMWPWRDWVIDALNRNLPFDQFTQWQLAGDQLPAATHEQKLATGFCRDHMINGEGGRIAEENRVEYIFDQIETLGTVWMGLTVQCCRCHDHKFDPVAQSEYYKLFAFFNQTPINGGGGDPQMSPNLSVASPEQSRLIDRLQREITSVEGQLRQAEAELGETDPLPNDVLEVLNEPIHKRADDHWKLLDDHFTKRNSRLVALGKTFRTNQDELNQARNRIPKVMIMQDTGPEKHRETFILEKGLYNQQREKVVADTPSFLPPLLSSKRDRLALAQWLTSPDHPLTARVTVNRIWQTFFGVGIVKTTEDFGVQGEKASHPDLLDWLACELVASGWDTKHIIRLIVTSATYQQSAKVSKQLLERDPENRLLARGPRSRMPSWMIRDHALSASGLMAGKLGGPSVKPYQPPGIWAEASFGNKKYEQDHGEALYRRSLYVYWRRIVGPTMFFDMAKRQTCSVRSSRTNTPLHALVTLNDTTYVEAARVMAERVMENSDGPRSRLTDAFRLATSRPPTPAETSLLVNRLQRLEDHYEDHPEEADQLTSVGAMPIRYEDKRELAAYSTMCLLILNLDEALTK